MAHEPSAVLEPQDARTLPAFATLGRDKPAPEPKTYAELVAAVAELFHNQGRPWVVEVQAFWNDLPNTQWRIWDGRTHYTSASPQGAFAALRSGRAPLTAVDVDADTLVMSRGERP